ncbi:hypothetical protein EDD90_1964 [Streptomyces sp. Ag109_O5-1]|uniref:hypothetical protein n=1 Tax=Streptomyces sp. Ag109_O5-1 TaxID=1938851 RepID=UPI000F4FE828|nr:hypothetical protein [Streptomyces sp. Ag109_O5-1]RPE39011.1 hypothetical protein EDD90_1964 [Streptomyces sp. Ag109_O5-1]
MLRQSIALRLTAPFAVVALTLTACGGKDGGTGAAQPASTEAKPSPSKTISTALIAGNSVSGKITEDVGTITYGVSALEVTFGTEAQAKATVQDPADAAGKVIAIAHVRYTHQAGPALTSSTNADDSTTVWADGQRGAILLGSPTKAPGCDDPYDIRSWTTGQSHTVCEWYLIPADAKKAQVHWSPDDGTPYVWTFPGPGA